MLESSGHGQAGVCMNCAISTFKMQGRAGAMSVLFPSSICRYGPYRRKLAHVHLERYAAIGREFAECRQSIAIGAAKPLFLYRTRTGSELKNRLPAFRASQSDLIHFHTGLVCHGADDYSQVPASDSARINCSHSWQIRLISDWSRANEA
jgi:hypothetical protein